MSETTTTDPADSTPFAWPPNGPALDAEGRLVGSILCRRCSYDLRGQAAVGACPECGSAVGWSALGDQFRFCDPVWVETLARGSTWLAIGVLCTALAGFVGPGFVGGAFSELLKPLAGVGVLIGAWMMTAPEPARQPVRLHLAIRICVALGVAGGIAAFFATTSSGGTLAWDIGLGATAVGGKLAEVAGVAMIFIMLRRYALRIPDVNLARDTRRVMIGFLIALGLLTLTVISAALTAGAAVAGGGTATIVAPAVVAGAFGCSGLIVLLIFGIWFIVLLFTYRGWMRQAAQHARETWARYGAAGVTVPNRASTDGPLTR